MQTFDDPPVAPIGLLGLVSPIMAFKILLWHKSRDVRFKLPKFLCFLYVPYLVDIIRWMTLTPKNGTKGNSPKEKRKRFFVTPEIQLALSSFENQKSHPEDTRCP